VFKRAVRQVSGQVKNDYITCSRAKSKYRISVAICETCKWMKSCPDYRTYRQPSLFPEQLRRQRITKAMYRRAVKAKRVVSESGQNADKPVQLSLNFS
jgi:hypothetical protein